MKQRIIFMSLAIFLFGILLVACGEDSLEPGLHYIGNDEFSEIVASDCADGYFVYIGRPTCDYCREFEPILEETLEYLEIGMYYFQTARARYDNEETMLRLLAPLNIEGIPIVVHLVHGQVAAYIIGVHTQEDIIAFIDENGGINN